jgi:hypothetical protein
VNIYRIQLKVKKLSWSKFTTINKIKLMKQILKDIFKEVKSQPTIVLFPAGVFDFPISKKIYIQRLSKLFSLFLKIYGKSSIIVFGIDFGVNKHTNTIKQAKKQMAVAISKDGIIALSNKFFSTKQEQGKINLSSSPYAKIDGFNAFFKYNNQSFVMAICYDVFGLRKKKIKLKKDIVILNLIHIFKKSEEGSGVFRYIKNGLARASYYFSCQVFCAAIFEDKDYHNYTSGIFVSYEVLNTWKYNDNEQKSESSKKQYVEILARIDKSFL